MANSPALQNLCEPKKWSIMVYLTGGMDISDEARECLLRMKQVGSTENFHLIAQFDSGCEGTFTKRYYLTPYDNALEVLMVLDQACTEVPIVYESDDDAGCMDYYHRLWRLLSPGQRKLLEAMPPEEMKKLIISSPDRFKNAVLNLIMDDDIYPRSSGNQGDTNSGKIEVLVDFIQWAKARYPAEHYMVIFWGHGSGLSVAWDFPPWPNIGPGDSLTAHELLKAFESAVTEFRSNFMEKIKEFIEEEIDAKNVNIIRKMNYPEADLRVRKTIDSQIKAFADEKTRTKNLYGSVTKITDDHAYKSKVDIVGFNSCSLATIEVCRQLSGAVDLVIASEGFTPKTSWPYDNILKALDADPGQEPEDFANKVVEEYIAYYKNLISMAKDLKELQREAKKLGIDWDPIYGYSMRGKGIGMRGKGIGMRGKGIGMRGKGIGMRGKGIGMGSEEELLEFGGVDLSVCYPEKTEEVSKCMRILSAKLRALLEARETRMKAFGAVKSAHAVSQSFFNGYFTDLVDFCSVLSKFYPDNKAINITLDQIDFQEIRLSGGRMKEIDLLKPARKPISLDDVSVGSICSCVTDAIEKMRVTEDKTGDDVRNSNGVSIFFPWGKWEDSNVTEEYKDLKFLNETGWEHFLKLYRDLSNNFEDLRADKTTLRGGIVPLAVKKEEEEQ